MGARRLDRPPLDRWTPDFSQLRSESFRPMPPLRVLQTVTAAAALFAILGACGVRGLTLPSPGPPRGIARPRPPQAEVTIRTLTGTWVAVWQTPDGLDTLTLSLVQRGDSVSGTLIVQGRGLASDPMKPAPLSIIGRFRLEVGQSHETVVVAGRPDATGDRISAAISGLSLNPLVLTFRRR